MYVLVIFFLFFITRTRLFKYTENFTTKQNESFHDVFKHRNTNVNNNNNNNDNSNNNNNDDDVDDDNDNNGMAVHFFIQPFSEYNMRLPNKFDILHIAGSNNIHLMYLIRGITDTPD